MCPQQTKSAGGDTVRLVYRLWGGWVGNGRGCDLVPSLDHPLGYPRSIRYDHIARSKAVRREDIAPSAFDLLSRFPIPVIRLRQFRSLVWCDFFRPLPALDQGDVCTPAWIVFYPDDIVLPALEPVEVKCPKTLLVSPSNMPRCDRTSGVPPTVPSEWYGELSDRTAGPKVRMVDFD